MKQGMNKIVYTAVALIVVIVLLANSLFIVQEGEYRAVLKFGEATRIHEDPGMNFKIPFIESTQSLPKYQMVYDSSSTSSFNIRQKANYCR